MTCELTTGCCGAPIPNTVNFAFCHFVLHGIFVTAFVFSNYSYPPYYYVDYIFGISSGVLIIVSMIGILVANLRKYQLIRGFWACIVVLNVLTVVGSTFYYCVERWNDIITTALTRSFRSPLMKDFPDLLWYTLAVTACVITPVFLIYLVYIISFMCNKWRSFLFTFSEPLQPTYIPPLMMIPSVPESHAYPTQKSTSN